MYESPCAKCKHATWYEHALQYGQCGHPVAVMVRNAPMVVGGVALSHTIEREWAVEPSPCACRAREVEP